MPVTCYLLGATWDDASPKNQLPRFIENEIWENGHEDKFASLVEEIPVGATVFAKAFYYHQGLKKQVLDIRARGEVTANPKDGTHLSVTWDSSFVPYKLTDEELPGIGGPYWDTIARVTEPTHLARLLNGTLPPRKKDTAPLSFPRNQILYGPPGTGKTYHTTARAVALLEGVSDDELAIQYPPESRAELRQKFEDYRAAGRIAFVTFHQAFTYEDFVEGIKPLPPTPVAESDVSSVTAAVQYDVQPGIFRRICENAATAANTTVAPPIPAFGELYDEFVEQLRHRMSETRGPLTFSSKTGEPMILTDIPEDKPGRLTFLHGNSGQQDHHIDKMWVEKLYKQYESIDQIKKLKQDITGVVGGSNATLMWVVFNELKKYEAQWLAQAREQERMKLVDATPTPFVLIIDEINRGNVANIFGELITLLEDDKRAGRAEAVTVQLPYSKKPFTVPDNLYVLGTMNTADRSVEALDTALRRRFSFTEMLPNPKLLPADIEGVNLQEMLTAINARLEQLLDHDHCIGHALLMRVTTLDGLREAFRRNILPLLQEYFFGDWGKIGLVIGNAFIYSVSKKQNATGYKLMSFDKYNTGELNEKSVYKLTDVLKLEAKAFQDIYA
ncbi:McrB family protein [Hymenobacter actinosclerus]|uniref:McrB family protein n=1 Tax=Hymenobacter actinosclerus TaxID=82805 RepID=UPI0015A6BABA|nr:AAA family ATPase [Hymenobacter actinosclerus]